MLVFSFFCRAFLVVYLVFFFFQAEDGIRDLVRSRGLGDVYKRQVCAFDLAGLGLVGHRPAGAAVRFGRSAGYHLRYSPRHLAGPQVRAEHPDRVQRPPASARAGDFGPLRHQERALRSPCALFLLQEPGPGGGAGGGVGTIGLQYAKLLGAVVTCVDKAEKFDMTRSLGADYLIEYTKEVYTRHDKQYDRILDVIAHRSVSDYKRALRPHGIFAMIGGSMGGLLLQLMFIWPILSRFSNKKLGIMGYRPTRKDLEYLIQLFEEGKLIPVIDRTYPLQEVPAAFQYFSEGNIKGKIIINVV